MAGLSVYFGGGLNDSPNCHPAEAFSNVNGGNLSANFDLGPQNEAFLGRNPIHKIGTCPKAVRGIMQLNKRDNTFTVITQGNDTIYKTTVFPNNASTFSSVGTCATSSRLRAAYWSLDDYLVITDLEKQTVVSRWDGTTFSTLTTGLGSALYAKYAIAHLGRIWLFNVKSGSTDTPHLLVASAFENPTSYDTTFRAGSSTLTAGTEAFYMTTPDLRGINGVALFFDTIIISTDRGRIYKLIGNDSRDFEWVPLYPGSYNRWEESMVNIGNDVVFVNSGGQVESLKSTDRYGDVAVDDLSRWIPITARTRLGDSSIPIMTSYDRSRQKVYFFQRDVGSATSNATLVLFKDVLEGGAPTNKMGERSQLSPWSLYTIFPASNVQAVGYVTISSAPVGDYVVIGCADGTIHAFDWTTAYTSSVESSGFQAWRVTRVFDKDTGWPAQNARGVIRVSRRSGATSGVSVTITPMWIQLGATTPATETATISLPTLTGYITGQPILEMPFTLRSGSGCLLLLKMSLGEENAVAIHEAKFE